MFTAEKVEKLDATVELNAFWQLLVSTLDVNASPSTAALPPSQFTSNRVSSGGHCETAPEASSGSGWIHESLVAMLLMEEILHQSIVGLSHYKQGCIHPRWCRISSIKSISKRDLLGRLDSALHRQLWFCHLFNSIVHTDCQGFMDWKFQNNMILLHIFGWFRMSEANITSPVTHLSL